MMNTWSAVGIIGGTGVLSYIAAGRKSEKGGSQLTFRLSLDKGNSLLGDVRLLGGALTLGGMYLAKDADTKKTLGIISLVSFASLFTTELVRIRLNKEKTPNVVEKLPVFPQFSWMKPAEGQAFSGPSYGALPGPQGQASYASYQPVGAGWAAR